MVTSPERAAREGAQSSTARSVSRSRAWPASVSQTDGSDSPRAGSAQRESWLALHLPCHVLESLGVPATAAQGPATVVVDVERGARIVCASDVMATRAGIVPGMALNSALALQPELRVLARDRTREQRGLEARPEWALRYTPRVSLEPPDAVLLEVRGSLRLFGGARRLCARIREELRASGLEVQLALTPTPLAALWFARCDEPVVLRRVEALPGRLASLPLECARWPERAMQVLATMGVRTIGECLRLPRAGFARRFDPTLLQMLDRAQGRVADPRAAFRPRQRFTARRDLEPEVTDLDALVEAVEPLLVELCEFLYARQAALQALEIALSHRESPVQRLRLGFARPATGLAHVRALVRERLARVQLAAAVRSLRVRSSRLVAATGTAEDLFAAAEAVRPSAVPELVERLRARLGVEAVHGLCLVPEHRPEAAWRIATELEWPRTRGRGEQRVADAAINRRPLWLLPQPKALDCDAAGQPRYEGRVELEEGPERIESGWWDGKDVARDYYVARSAAGVRLWIFRERSPVRRSAAQGGWFLHGVFG
jgi:protein ImuB